MTFSIKTCEIQYTAPDGTDLIGYFAAPESENRSRALLLRQNGGDEIITQNNARAS